MAFVCLNGLLFGLRFRKCGICSAKYKRLECLSDALRCSCNGSSISAASPACWNRARRRIELRVFSSKKGEHLNPLKSLNPKRQIQAVNRQERAICRQKVLALLSFVCQCPDCSVTKSEDENDG